MLGLLMKAGYVSGKALWRLDGVNGRVEEAVFSDDAAMMALRMVDGRVIIRDLPGLLQPVVFNCQPYAVIHIAISPDGTRVVWTDNSGRAFSWSLDSGLVERNMGDSALVGSRMTDDGEEFSVASDGQHVYILNTEKLTTEASPLDAFQIRSMAITPDGSTLYSGDHSGLISRLDRQDISNPLTVSIVSKTGVQGIFFIPGDPGNLAVWDDEGVFHLYSADLLEEKARIQLVGKRVCSYLQDSLNNRIYFSFDGGPLQAISLVEPYTVKLIAAVDQAIVGMGFIDQGSIGMITENGSIWEMDSAEITLLRDTVWAGELTRLSPRIQTSEAGLNSEAGHVHIDLVSGQVTGKETGTFKDILSNAYLAGDESQWIELTMKESVSVVQSSDPISELPVISFTEWLPIILSTGTWTPRIGLMSADGVLEVYELKGQDAPQWSRIVSLDPDLNQIWSRLEFTNRDNTLIAYGRSRIRLIDLSSGQVTSHTIPEGRHMQEVAYSKEREVLYYSSNYNLYRLDLWSGIESNAMNAADESPIISLKIEPDSPILDVWTITQQYGLNMEDLDESIAGSLHSEPLISAVPARDGPFSLLVTSAGDLILDRLDSALLAAVYPDLAIAPGGGMMTNYFGRIEASFGSWISHQSYGWGKAQKQGDTDWYWFGSEGWLAGGADLHPFMYSMIRNSWYYCLMPLYDTPWIFDYGIMEWRKFGE